MSTPIDFSESDYSPVRNRKASSSKPSGDDEGTIIGEGSVRHLSPPRATTRGGHLTLLTDTQGREDIRSIQSPSRSREEAHRLEDDLTMLKAELVASSQQEEAENGLSRSRSMRPSRSRREDPPDDFDLSTMPAYEKGSIYKPPENPSTNVAKIFKKIHNSFWLVRYFLYIIPVTGLLLIPLLLGAITFEKATVGGVSLLWFSIWLEIIWLTLWAGRILAKCLPFPIGLVSSIFTNNDKKWRDMGKQLEIPATLFFWGLATFVSFLPIMTSHHADKNPATKNWESIMDKILISVFVAFVLNFAEKIAMQLIAISFHLRTYADRIEVNKFQIDSLVKLYEFSRKKFDFPDQEFEEKSAPASGTRTPGQIVKVAQKSTVVGFKKISDVAGKIAGDFTGRDIVNSTHPHQVILTLLSSTEGSQVLARRLYRTFCRDDLDNVHADDLRPAFNDDEEADAAFTMFDKDMNGDISMEELESVCVEMGRERKSITASLKDLEGVISKLNKVFVFIVIVITILVFVSLISTSAAGVLTSAGSTVLALSWLFSATAQEFLQSIVFVFVKHPFDVGDRVSIYGNTGSTLKGDDYFVKEISLLYTEFKKMEGHIVQAPNSYLNTLFILNQRRSGGLAEAIPVIIKYGTTIEQIDGLRQRLLDFVLSEKREYQGKILTELRDVTEAHSITLNVVFFYKSNWQNELLRLQRRNKFICVLMVCMQELGMEGPRMRYPGQKESFPVYLQNLPHGAIGASGPASGPAGRTEESTDPPFVEPVDNGKEPVNRRASILRRPRGESLAEMGRRVDFSLGMKDVASSDITGDVYEDRSRIRLPPAVTSPTRATHSDPRERTSGETGRPSREFTRAPNPGMFGNRLTRVGTDTTLARDRSNHRNRFFSRGRAQDDNEVMEAGVAGIPEYGRLDPRSGMISPAAWRVSLEEGIPLTEIEGASSSKTPEKKES